MIDIFKNNKKHNFKLLKNKQNILNEKSFNSLLKHKKTKSLIHSPKENIIDNNKYSHNKSNILNSKDIQEIQIDFHKIPKNINNKYKIQKKNKNQNILDRSNSLSLKSKINNSYLNESINSPNIYQTNPNISDYIQNNSYTYTQPRLEAYETKLNINKKRKKENNSIDITYYKPLLYLNSNENNNSFLKKSDNNGYYSQNNSFYMNKSNNDEDNKLNNTINYNQEKYAKRKYSLIMMNNIPKPQKLKKKIPPIPIRKSNESYNNSFYFDENNMNKINNNLNKRYYDIKTVNNSEIYNNKRKIFIKNNISEYKNKKYKNNTQTPKNLKGIENFGIKLSFSIKKKNDSIELLTPELFNDLKSFSIEHPKDPFIFSDLDANRENKFNNNDNKNLKKILLNKMESYDKMRKKYIKRLSSYLLKNKKNKNKKNLQKKGKYDIIDIKEKIKEERKRRSISNTYKFMKKEIIKDSPLATLIKKENDKGGKIDFILPKNNIRNKSYNYRINSNTKTELIFKHKINQYYLDDNINKNILILNSAKTIQKWWRNLLFKFFTELSIIKIQSILRSFLFRKKFLYNKNNNENNEIYLRKENIEKIKLIQKIWREFYSNLKKITINTSSSINNEEKIIYKKLNKYQYENNFFGHMSLKNMHIQQNSNFKIINNKRTRSSFHDKKEKNYFEELIKSKNIKDINNKNFSILENKYHNNSFNNEFINDILFNQILIPRNNLKICFYTKENYKNIGENSIKKIQKYFKNFIINKNNNLGIKDEKEEIIKFPILIPSFIIKTRIKKYNKNSKNMNHNFSISNNSIIILSSKNINIDKYTISKNQTIYENKISIKENENNYEATNLLNKEQQYNKNNNNEKSFNQKIQGYAPNIDLSINKENIIEIKRNILIQKCYFIKNNIILIKKKSSEYQNTKINSDKHNDSLDNEKVKNNSTYIDDYSLIQKKKNEFKITKNISNYIKSSYSQTQKYYNLCNSNNYLISSFSNEIKGKTKDQFVYEIKTNNINLISSKNNNGKNKLEIGYQDKDLNYSGIKVEPTTQIPNQVKCFFTKNNVIIENYYKYKEKNLKLKSKHFILNKNDNENNEESIYKYPFINKFNYISKIYKKDVSKQIITLQKFIKNIFNKIRNKPEKNYVKIITSNNIITKEYKDNRLSKNKIKFIQKIFRKYRKKKQKLFMKTITQNDNNRILNNQMMNSNRINIQSRNNNIRKHYSFSYQKNSQTDENIATNYGTNSSSYKISEKKENILEKTNIINKCENIIHNKYSYKSYNNNEKYEKYEKNEYEKKENKKQYKLYSYENEYQIKVKNKKEEKYYKDNQKINIFIKFLNILYFKHFFFKLKDKIYKSKQCDMIKILIQRINKKINQYVFYKIKTNNNININLSLYYKLKKENFFFSTIKRHLNINKIDNNWKENNEIIYLLKKNLPDYFKNYPKRNYIPYINKNQEKNLINNQLYLFNDEKLAEYLYKCYKTEKNIFTIMPYIIKNRLIKNPLKNQNIFTITRYMDNLYNDIKTNNICKNCYCKNSELCLVGCPCHNSNNNFINDSNYKSKNRNYLINNNKEIKSKKNIKFEILKRFSESDEGIQLNNNSEINDNIYRNTYAYQTFNKNMINNENFDRNSNLTEYIKKCHTKETKTNNFIRDFIIRKKKRKSIITNENDTSNINNENVEINILKYNYNNFLKEKSIPKINLDYDYDYQYEQCNVYDDDIQSSIEYNNKHRKINKSLTKKKLSPIIPISNKINNIIKKVNSFRYEKEKYRNKYKEIIKLRDTNINYDNEIYENI